MALQEGRERDLVLAPGEFANILDETKGHVSVWVGPTKTSLAGTDKPVQFDAERGRFIRCSLEEAIQLSPFAREGWYIVLHNPASGKGEQASEYPASGSNNLPKLQYGRKVNLPGPVTFPLWPSQVADVIEGHHLRSNQYLVVRVYDERAAKENWKQGVMLPQMPPPGTKSEEGKDDEAKKTAGPVEDKSIVDLTMGKLLVIRGTEISFYIPPTGIEVVPDSRGNYVRDAVTLERLEYCILLDEDGNKRYVRGPAVVFPEPTETFVEERQSRKFRAVELNDLMGIYIKVIADYKEAGHTYKVGDELFITGKEQKIYFPRSEHAIIKYGEEDIHFGVAIPAGEARYVLNRETGEIFLKKGPLIFLPDPRKETIIRRVLEPSMVALLYPGNKEALEYNTGLKALIGTKEPARDFIEDKVLAATARLRGPRAEDYAVKAMVSEELQRRPTFTPPRTITLDTKYEGAVTVNIWTGYAVLVVSKTGDRRVAVGPKSVLLEYHESLEAIELSTGTPKSDDKLIKTVYLRALNNTVSDIIEAETKDLCRVNVRCSYRVNFDGEPEKWFNVENYVKFLTDHLRSLIRNAVKQRGIQEFHSNAINIIRDTVLGVMGEAGKRPGRLFPENGMRVYDVEVLDMKIGDTSIQSMLVGAQQEVVSQTLKLERQLRDLEVTKKSEDIKQQIAKVQTDTVVMGEELEKSKIVKRLETELAQLAAKLETKKEQLVVTLAEQDELNKIKEAQLQRQKSEQDLGLELRQKELKQFIEQIEAETKAVKEKIAAITPDLIAAMEIFSNRDLAGKLSENLSVLSILGGKNVTEVFQQMLGGTFFGDLLKKISLGAKDKKNE